MESVYSFLREAQVFYLATLEGETPRVRPMGSIDLFEGKLYFLTAKSKKVSQQMQAHPRIELSAIRGEEWIRVEATVVRDDRKEPKIHMLETYPMLKGMYSAEDDNTEVLYLKDAIATFYTFTGEPVVVNFG